jgi:hypothetical protein
MARIANKSKTTKPVARGRKPGRPAAAVAKTAPKKKVPAATKAPAPAPAPKLSKDELRVQVDKLERANATLRAKSREVTKAAKTALARVAELEDQVARLDEELAGQKAARPAASPPKRRRPAERHEVDPGDAVPPGVAVQEPEPQDTEAETARENLEEHLGHDTSEDGD